MANQVIVNGTFTLSIGSIRPVGTVATTINLTGSNYVDTVQNITSSGYVGLDTSSLSDIRAGFFANLDLTASVALAFDSAGTKPIAILQPDTEITWMYSGSVAASSIYAKALNTTGSIALQYLLVES